MSREEISVDEVVFDKSLYPRERHQQHLVNLYRANLDKLPAIVVQNKSMRVIDGYHRLLAYRLEGVDKIEAKVLDISDDDAKKLAVRANASHGQQLSMIEKKSLIKDWYGSGFCTDLNELSNIFKVSRSFVEKNTKRIRNEKKKERNQKIFDMWLACHTQKQIAEKINIDRPRVTQIVANVRNRICTKINNDPPDCLQLYNHWSFSRCDPDFGFDYRGRLPGQVVQNLLWYYTKPLDLVVDPMAGSGTTIDVCKRMNRRWLAYDINPFEDKGIKKNDIIKDIPEIPVKQRAKLILLDPPYWNQYSDGDNWWCRSVKSYVATIEEIFENCKKLLSDDGHISLIISQTRKNGKNYDLPFLCYKRICENGFRLEDRIAVPYNKRSESSMGAWEADAKENRYLPRDNRDLMVFKVETQQSTTPPLQKGSLPQGGGKMNSIAGRGKVRIDKVSVGSEFESVPKDKYQVSITNLSMPIDLDSNSVIEEIE